MTKKYYWLKLQKDFFKRHDIRIIESMANGKDYILFYLKLLVESVSHEGELRFSETIPYNEEMLATITDTNIDIVRCAMKVFQELQMIEVLEDRTIFMSEVNKMIGSETTWAEKKRIYREQQRTMSSGCLIDVRQEKEIELEKEKELEIELEDKPKRKRFTPPTLEEIENYIFEKGYTVDAEKFFYYYEANGWKVGRNPMKNWQATVSQWNARDKKEQPKAQSVVDKWANA